jgi:uncharacterized membrane protein
MLLNSTVNADFINDVSDWATDNPELSIPIGVIGAPVALAAIPMIISYTLFQSQPVRKQFLWHLSLVPQLP